MIFLQATLVPGGSEICGGYQSMLRIETWKQRISGDNIGYLMSLYDEVIN